MNTTTAAPIPETNSETKPTAARALSRSSATAHDAVLVQRFKAGDESAFTEIVHRHYARIRGLAQKTLHNEADAEEVAQDTFIRAHRGLANFRGDASLATWLHCIGLNLSRNRYWFFFRRHRQDTISIDRAVVEGSSVTLIGALSDGKADPRTESMANEFNSMVAACMERLDGSHYEILTMRTVLSLSYEEIAGRLGINVGTVKSRIARARESLRKLLLQAAPEFGKQSTVSDFFESCRPQPTPGFAAA